MKGKISDKILKEVRSTSKKIIKEEFPQEMEFFDVIWSTMKEYLSALDEIDLQDWQVKEYQSRIMRGLGFTDPSQQPDITAPIIIAVLAAVFWHIGTLITEPRNEDIERMVEDYSGKFGASEEVKEKLKNFLQSSSLTSFLRKEILIPKSRRIMEAKASEGDTLEIGIKDDHPYVMINEKEAREFRTKYKQFSNLVLLASARKKEKGWVRKKPDLDLGQSDQALSDIRSWIARLLINDIFARDVIKSREQRDGTVRLEVFNPENINIKESICKFRPRSLRIVKELVNKALEKKKITEGIQPLLEKSEYFKLKNHKDLTKKQMEIVEMGLDYLKLELDEKNWKEIIEKSEEIIENCYKFYLD